MYRYIFPVFINPYFQVRCPGDGLLRNIVICFLFDSSSARVITCSFSYEGYHSQIYHRAKLALYEIVRSAKKTNANLLNMTGSFKQASIVYAPCKKRLEPHVLHFFLDSRMTRRPNISNKTELEISIFDCLYDWPTRHVVSVVDPYRLSYNVFLRVLKNFMIRLGHEFLLTPYS